MKGRPTVYLVGCGPGDPELLTLKARRILDAADIVLYDSLVGDAILATIPEQTQRIHVGKRLGRHSISQPKLNELMLAEVRAGRTVVRLKGGDPFLFGRGGEELIFLHDHGISVEVIPGVTSASALAASLQIPLTHREYGPSVIFLTGYSSSDGGRGDGFPDHDWPALASDRLTLVFYMGLHHFQRICATLIDAGRRPDTPVSVVSHISLPDENRLATSLERAAIEAVGDVEFPALIVVGDVLKLGQP